MHASLQRLFSHVQLFLFFFLFVQFIALFLLLNSHSLIFFVDFLLDRMFCVCVIYCKENTKSSNLMLKDVKLNCIFGNKIFTLGYTLKCSIYMVWIDDVSRCKIKWMAVGRIKEVIDFVFIAKSQSFWIMFLLSHCDQIKQHIDVHVFRLTKYLVTINRQQHKIQID